MSEDIVSRVVLCASWQQLGEDFKDHVFRFQILDEAAEHGRDWSDDLKHILEADESPAVT